MSNRFHRLTDVPTRSTMLAIYIGNNLAFAAHSRTTDSCTTPKLIPLMSWSLKFDEPIAAPNHLKLRTLRDAGNYIADLPDAIQQWPVWQTAAEMLMLTAEGKRSVMFAQIAMLQALNYGRPVEAAMPRTKAAKKYRIVR